MCRQNRSVQWQWVIPRLRDCQLRFEDQGFPCFLLQRKTATYIIVLALPLINQLTSCTLRLSLFVYKHYFPQSVRVRMKGRMTGQHLAGKNLLLPSFLGHFRLCLQSSRARAIFSSREHSVTESGRDAFEDIKLWLWRWRKWPQTKECSSRSWKKTRRHTSSSSLQTLDSCQHLAFCLPKLTLTFGLWHYETITIWPWFNTTLSCFTWALFTQPQKANPARTVALSVLLPGVQPARETVPDPSKSSVRTLLSDGHLLLVSWFQGSACDSLHLALFLLNPKPL